MRKLSFGLMMLALAACSGGDNTPDVWALKGDASSLTFVTNKNNAIDETHSFKILTGRVTADGVATIRVPLISVDTLIPTRDERMGTMLFETKQYPELVVISQLDMRDLRSIDVGATAHKTVHAQIVLHGRSVVKPIFVIVTRQHTDRVRVVTPNPVTVEAADFGLEAGVDALRDIAGLKEISYTVPVSFDLTFIGQ